MLASSPAAARFLAPSQVAELLTISVDEVIHLVQEGRLRGAKLGVPARWRVDEASVSTYLEEQVEEARQMSLWAQSQAASFPELWSTGAYRAE